MSYELVPSILGGPERTLGGLGVVPTDGRSLAGFGDLSEGQKLAVGAGLIALTFGALYLLCRPEEPEPELASPFERARAASGQGGPEDLSEYYRTSPRDDGDPYTPNRRRGRRRRR